MKDLTAIWEERNWFAIQSRPHKEAMAAAGVVRLGLECFLPKTRQRQNVCGVSRLVTKAFFPGYFFSQFVPRFMAETLRFTPGVLRLVGTRSFPIPVDAEVISGLQDLSDMASDGLIPVEPSGFMRGARLYVEEGPFQGFLGRVERESDDGKRVVLLLEALQQARLLIEKQFVAVAEPAF